MSDDLFDINDIVYANNYTKITLKSKQILDSLAAQVALWNLEKHQMLSNKENQCPKIQSRFSKKNESKLLLSNIQLTPINTMKNSINKSENVLLNSTGIVKKQAAFFESLSTPIQDRKFVLPKKICTENLDFPLQLDMCNLNLNNNINEHENIDTNFEDPLPPPPSPILSDIEYHQLMENNLMSNSFKDYIEPTSELPTYISSPIQTESFRDEFTNVSSIRSSTGSIYDDIAKTFAKSNPIIYEATKPMVEIKSKKIRRSLSFNDTVEYIYLTSLDESNDKPVADSSISDQSEEIVERSQSIDTDEDTNTLLDTKFSTIELERELDSIKSIGKELLGNVKVILSNSNFQIGGQEHTKICREIVKNILITKSITEKIIKGPQKSLAVLGSLRMEKIRFAVKENYVWIEYDELVSKGYSDQLNKLTQLYHMVLFVRCVGESPVSKSRMFTLVDRDEASKFGLKYQILDWLEMFYFVNFDKLSADFKLKFDLYSMSIMPKKEFSKLKCTPRKNTPIKKNLNLLSIENERSSFFTSIASLEITAETLLLSSDTITRKLHLPSNCPFSGNVKFKGHLNLEVLKKCEGRLNVYMDVGGKGAWSYRDCEVTRISIIGGKRNVDTDKIDNPDLVIPFHLFKEPATMCSFNICARPNSFSILLNEDITNIHVPVNRRISTDGKRKSRFLAMAESTEDTQRWCRMINNTRDAFVEWAKSMPSVTRM